MRLSDSYKSKLTNLTTLSIYLIAYPIADYRKVIFYSNSLIFTTRTNKVFPSEILSAMYSNLCPIHTLDSPLQAKLIFYVFFYNVSNNFYPK